MSEYQVVNNLRTNGSVAVDDSCNLLTELLQGNTYNVEQLQTRKNGPWF